MAISLSHPCRQMSLSEPKHTNTSVLFLLSANYVSKWIFFQILVGSSGNQNTLPASQRSRETTCCMRAADAYYWFTLWPRKRLIAYAEAAWHLTIRCGERDDWIAHKRYGAPSRLCVCTCVAVHVYSVQYIIISLQGWCCFNWLFGLKFAIGSVLSQVLLF